MNKNLFKIAGFFVLCSFVAIITAPLGGQPKNTRVLLTSNLASGRVPYAVTNNKLTGSANLTFDNDNLTVAGRSSQTGAAAASGHLNIGSVSTGRFEVDYDSVSSGEVRLTNTLNLATGISFWTRGSGTALRGLRVIEGYAHTDRAMFGLGVGAVDAGIIREGNGVLRVVDGGTNHRDIALRNLYLGGNGQFLSTGSGSPEGVVTAPPGSLYTDRTSGKLHIKESGTGNTGWVMK